MGAAKQMQFHMIVVCQDDVGQSCGDMACRQKFFLRGREGHGGAGIDKDIGEEIDLFTEEFDIESVGAGVDAPIEVAQIISRRVAPIVGEFQTGAPPGRGIAARLAAQELFSVRSLRVSSWFKNCG